MRRELADIKCGFAVLSRAGNQITRAADGAVKCEDSQMNFLFSGSLSFCRTVARVTLPYSDVVTCVTLSHSDGVTWRNAVGK